MKYRHPLKGIALACALAISPLSSIAAPVKVAGGVVMKSGDVKPLALAKVTFFPFDVSVIHDKVQTKFPAEPKPLVHRWNLGLREDQVLRFYDAIVNGKDCLNNKTIAGVPLTSPEAHPIIKAVFDENPIPDLQILEKCRPDYQLSPFGWWKGKEWPMNAWANKCADEIEKRIPAASAAAISQFQKDKETYSRSLIQEALAKTPYKPVDIQLNLSGNGKADLPPGKWWASCFHTIGHSRIAMELSVRRAGWRKRNRAF